MNSDAQVGDDFQICDRFSLGDLSRMFCNLATMGSTGQQRQLLSCKYRIMDVPLTSPARFSAVSPVSPVSPVSLLELKRLGSPWAANLSRGDHVLAALHKIRTGSADTTTRISCLPT